MKAKTLSSFFVLLLAGTSLESRAQEWSRFRGPDGAGIGTAPRVPSSFTAEAFAWDVKLPGHGHSSPVLWGDRLVVTCDQGQQRGIACMDASTGQLLWTWWTPYRAIHNHGDNSFAAATPSLDAQRVYLSWVDGGRVVAVAIDHAGRQIWQRPLGAFSATHGAGSSPALVGDVLVVPNDQGAEGAAVYGLDAATGEIRWQMARLSGNPSYATPATYRDANGRVRVLLSAPSHGLSAIDPADGSEVWHKDDLFTLNVVASPVYADGVVLATAGRGGQREAVVLSVGGDTPGVLYKPGRDLPYVPTPVLVGDLAFLWSDSGTVSCGYLKTGKLAWRQKVTGPTYASPISDGKRVFGISRKGEVVVFEVGSEYKELGRSQLPEGTHATPAFAHGALFIRTFNRVIRVGR